MAATLSTRRRLVSRRFGAGAVCLVATGALLVAAAVHLAQALAHRLLWHHADDPHASRRTLGTALLASWIAAEAAFAVFWRLVLRRRLEAMPLRHGPSFHRPERVRGVTGARTCGAGRMRPLAC